MEENPNPYTSLDDTRKQKLLYWYNLILTQLRATKSSSSICMCISFLGLKGEITRLERKILIDHFLSIPRPKDANTHPLDYYWDINNFKYL